MDTDAEPSSRIFVRGLPPTMTDVDFKKHFSKFPITDARLFPQRRIGYVGYKTPEDAVKAVKYFNRTFIRMSKIGVELARPIGEAPTSRRSHPQSQWTHESSGFRASAGLATTVSEPTDSAEAQNSLKRKRGSPDPVRKDPKLQEFLQAMQPPSKLRGHAGADPDILNPVVEIEEPKIVVPEADSDSEYENVPKKAKNTKSDKDDKSVPPTSTGVSLDSAGPIASATDAPETDEARPDEDMVEAGATTAPVTDEDWLRSRTSRLLGLAEDDDEEDVQASTTVERRQPSPRVENVQPEVHYDGEADVKGQARAEEYHAPTVTEGANAGAADETEEKIRASKRLYLRNLSYNINEEDLRNAFDQFGNLDEVHVPMDTKTSTPKGFAYLQFTDADSALAALRVMDGKVFQGRLLHILPAAVKRESQLDEFTLSKLPLKKQQQIKRKKEASTTTFNWNALYMNADTVMSSVADRLGVSKAELLDPTSSDAAIKQAHAETHVIQETKAYFKEHGVDLEAFKKRERGDTAILVKNFPYDAKASELKELFEEHGKVKRFLMPPAGTIAIVEFDQPPQARAAFAALAYRKIRSSVLFLEKAPKSLFTSTAPAEIDGTTITQEGVAPKISTSELLEDTDAQEQPIGTTSTLFVRNLNFTTTSERLSDTFNPLSGFLSARVKTRTDPKKPGQVLSMGFGFAEFRTQQQAQAALAAMDGFSLDGHKLQIRASHRATDAAEERRKEDQAKKLAGRRTKIIIKNLPFETTKKDVRALFGAYGQLRSVRVPRKFDKGARGFAFAEFTTPKEAESAMDALRDTHLLGRRLVIDFASEDPEDAEAEIEKMQQKAGSQLNKVALQKLTAAGRKKFRVGDEQEED